MLFDEIVHPIACLYTIQRKVNNTSQMEGTNNGEKLREKMAPLQVYQIIVFLRAQKPSERKTLESCYDVKICL